MKKEVKEEEKAEKEAYHELHNQLKEEGDKVAASQLKEEYRIIEVKKENQNMSLEKKLELREKKRDMSIMS